ncbi:ATP-binding protein [Achromobacter sp. SLBN-14]|uniref:ATP-binding protein n=1 Tax=Achromobacter sp. SLBN-14 TaxID=2768442 RepID=UPI0011546BE3|nr:ATP-binding protein [Achromobacter sp. SLBN-14]TQJ94690.1 phospho-acceptor domain-containing protein [Achromobacter sp. SLBN-14]
MIAIQKQGSGKCGVVLIGEGGDVRSWDKAMENLTGIDATSAIGLRFEDLKCLRILTGPADGMSPNGASVGFATIADFPLPPSNITSRCLVFTRQVPASYACASIQYPTSASQVDATEINVRQSGETQNQIMQTEKLAAIGQLAAGVAHEINNPIGYVFSNLKTLGNYVRDLLKIVDAVDGVAHLDDLRHLKRNLEYDYIRHDLEALLNESADGIDRVKKIITALKDFSRPEDEGFRDFDLHHGIETTLKVVNNEIKYKANVICEFGVLPLVECNGSQINQVTLNLLINAAQAIETKGIITVRSGVDGQEVWFEVQDTGCGMEADALRRIFEPFYTTKQLGKGTGLGLALSYSIVEQHSGRIDVFSELGRGSRFRVWLPIRQKVSEA